MTTIVSSATAARSWYHRRTPFFPGRRWAHPRAHQLVRARKTFVGRMGSLDRATVTVPLDPYLSLKALVCYSGLSRRTLQAHLHDPHDPIPSFRVGGRILVRRSEFDAWMARRRNTKAQALAQMAAADAEALLTARAHKIS